MKKFLYLINLCFICFIVIKNKVLANEIEYLEQDNLVSYTTEIGELYGIDPYILQALCEKESSLNIYAENASGTCKGLTQINDFIHQGRMQKLGVEDIYDPYSNILVCADYLSELRDENDDIYYMLMRYNMKTKTANKLYQEGIISDYAKSIVLRAGELKYEDLRLEREKLIESQKNEEILAKQEIVNQINMQKIEDGKNKTLQQGGISVWLQ